jgi:hypothetical protein
MASRGAKAVQLALVLLAATALVSCGGSAGASQAERREARHVAVSWLEAMSESDIREACRLMDADNHRSHPDYPQWSPAKNCEEQWLHSDNTPLDWKPKPDAISIWGESSPRVLKVILEGDEGIVKVEGIGMERPVWLRREHGRWLVDSVEYPI